MPSYPPASGWHEVAQGVPTTLVSGTQLSRSLSCPGHGVAQLGFIVDEGHEPHVVLDEEGALQHQHGIRLPWQWALLLGLLDSLDQESLEAFQL